MAEARPQVAGLEYKRRKVRKGTQSCWECRRRKVRCIFTVTTDAICKNCRRRKTACIGQEHPDEPTPSSGGSSVNTRLGRAGEVSEHMADSGVPSHVPTSVAEGLLEGRTSVRCEKPPKLATSEVEAGRPLDRTGCNTIHVPHKGESTCPGPSSRRLSPATATISVQSTSGADKYKELSRALIEAWPSQREIDIIRKLPGPPTPQEMLQLPQSGSHPVLIARQLLVLGIFLQGVRPSSIQDLSDLRVPYRHIMSRVVDTAIDLVTTNEDLIGSVEGVECIMIEAMYQNYAGNLHRAWMAVRRATTVVQMMALDRGLKSSSLKILEPETHASFSPDQICFRLAQMDCYLSLMLGLPRTSLRARFATPIEMERCQPIDRLQRIHCVLADRILRCSESDLSETHDIDTQLQKAAAEMPPQWWLIPNLSASNSDSTGVLHETVRLMDQLTHYHLLTRLHLPYMLRSSPDRRYDHSNITAVNASRETLARFVAFRTSNSAHFYCRGTDFLAFIATTVLCLAHIESGSRREGPAQTPKPLFNPLSHSRPSDRGMMERTLDIFDCMVRSGADAIAFKISRILRHLLAIEANAASGTGYYSTSSSKSDEKELECHGKLTDGGKGLNVYIPYIGTINFERQASSKSSPTVPTAPEQSLPSTLVSDIPRPGQLGEHNRQPPSGSDRPPACQVASPSGDYDEQAMQWQLGQTALPQQPPSPGNGAFSFSNEEGQPPIAVGNAGAIYDWDLQGVDVALFDSLFRGAANSDTPEEEFWRQWASS